MEPFLQSIGQNPSALSQVLGVLQDKLAVIIEVIDVREWRLMEMNLFGRNFHGLQGNGPWSREETVRLVSAEDRERFRASHPDWMKPGPTSREPVRFEQRRRRSDGVWVWFATHAFFLPGPEETSSRILNFSLDISAHKAVEKDLTQVQDRFRLILENMTDCIWTCDLGMNFDYLTPSIERLLGYTAEEIKTGGTTLTLTPEALQTVATTLQEELAKEMVHPGTTGSRVMVLPQRHKRGHIVWTEVHTLFLRDAQGAVLGVAGLTRDITARFQAEEARRDLLATLEDKVRERTRELQRANRSLRREIAERRRAQDEAEQAAERERRRLGMDLHDDFCQRLAGISCLCRSLRPSLGQANDLTARTLPQIEEQLTRMGTEIRDIARGLYPLGLAGTDLVRALEELLTTSGRSFDMACTLKVGTHLAEVSDETALHLYRIVQEFIHNASQHGKATRVTVALNRAGSRLRLVIQDNGQPPAASEKNPAAMGSRTIRDRVWQMRGRLSVSRPAQGGTRLACSFPLGPLSPGPGITRKTPSPAGARADGQSRAARHGEGFGKPSPHPVYRAKNGHGGRKRKVL